MSLARAFEPSGRSWKATPRWVAFRASDSPSGTLSSPDYQVTFRVASFRCPSSVGGLSPKPVFTAWGTYPPNPLRRGSVGSWEGLRWLVVFLGAAAALRGYSFPSGEGGPKGRKGRRACWLRGPQGEFVRCVAWRSPNVLGTGCGSRSVGGLSPKPVFTAGGRIPQTS